MPCLCQLLHGLKRGISISNRTSSAFTPCLPLGAGWEVGVQVTFCLGSTGECLPVIAAAVCDHSAGQLPARALPLLNEAPHRVQGSADLQGEHRAGCAGLSVFLTPLPEPWAAPFTPGN